MLFLKFCSFRTHITFHWSINYQYQKYFFLILIKTDPNKFIIIIQCYKMNVDNSSDHLMINVWDHVEIFIADFSIWKIWETFLRSVLKGDACEIPGVFFQGETSTLHLMSSLSRRCWRELVCDISVLWVFCWI